MTAALVPAPLGADAVQGGFRDGDFVFQHLARAFVRAVALVAVLPYQLVQVLDRASVQAPESIADRAGRVSHVRNGATARPMCFASRQRNELGRPGALRKIQPRQGDGQAEAPPPRAAGIDIEHAALAPPSRLVGMAADHDIEAHSTRVEIEIPHAVQNVNARAACFGNGGRRQLCGPGFGIDIAADRRDGRDAAQGFKDFRPADISRMQDEMAAGKRAEGFGAQQPVGIGNQAKAGSRKHLSRV